MIEYMKEEERALLAKQIDIISSQVEVLKARTKSTGSPLHVLHLQAKDLTKMSRNLEKLIGKVGSNGH